MDFTSKPSAIKLSGPIKPISIITPDPRAIFKPSPTFSLSTK